MLKKVLILLSLAILAGLMGANVTIFHECVPTFTEFPANWTSNNGGGQAIYQSATSGYLLVDHIDDWVITSAYDLSSYSNVELSLAVATYGSGTNNPLTIDVSNDNGVTWSHQSFVSETPTSISYISAGVFAITGNHSQVRFRFRRNASSGKGVRFRSILLQSGEQTPAPALSISPSALQGFSYQFGYGPSTAQNFVVQGNNLVGNINLIATSDYQISQNAQSGFTSSISLVPQNGSVLDGTIYVRLAEGLTAGTYNGSVQISSQDAQTQGLTLSGSVTEPQVAGDYFVDFEGEGETKVSYASGTVSLSGIPWNLTEVLIGDLAADVINGLRVARFRGYGASAMTMLEDKSGGIGTLSFLYKAYSTDPQVSWRVEYSSDGGNTWMQVGTDFIAPSNNEVQSFSALINTSASGRVRIRKAEPSGTANARMNIDDILITDYNEIAQPLIAINPTSLTGFTYQEGSGPSLVQSFQVQGSNLQGDIDVWAPLSYEISLSVDSGFTGVLSLSPQAGTVNTTSIYVRLLDDLTSGTFYGDILLNSQGAQSREVSLTGNVTPVAVIDGYLVDFEGAGETKGSYASGDVTLSGIDWNLTEALIGDSTDDLINGIRAARLRGWGTSAMTMFGDKTGGLGTLSFLYKRYGSDPQVEWKAEYSIDGGITWIQAGANFIAPDNNAVQTFSAVINTATTGRIRIISAQTSGSSNARMNLDDISITDYSGSSEPQIAVNPTSLTGFDYNEGFGPSAAQTFALTAMFVTADIVVSASANYEISLDGADYHQQIFLSPQTGTVSQPIYVRLKANLLTGSYPGNVVCDSPEAGSISVSLSGTVSTFTIPDAPLALAATEITSSSFKANWQAVAGATSYRLDVYTTTSAGGFDDLIISEYIEGTSNNKALEIYNGTGSTVSLTDYAVQIFSNGASNPSFNINLGGNLPNGDVYVLAHASANPDILSEADYTNAYAISFNGDDAVAIYNTSTGQYVDIFGVIGDDPGTAWTAAGGYSTLDKTLVRRPEVRSGITQNPSGTGPGAFSTLATEWIVHPVDTFAYLGSHSLTRRDINYVPGYQDLFVGTATSHVVSGLNPDADYFYVVRAVNANGSSDNSNTIEVFTQVISTPSVQARQIAGAATNETISLEWIPGNGSKRIVVMNTTNFFNTPANGSDPAANPVYGGSGQQVVYNGATQIIEDMPYDGVLVEGLAQDTTYHFRVFEYNGFGSNTIYLSSTATGNPAQFNTLSGGFTGYYEDIEGYGAVLKADLHELLRTTHVTRYSYDALWTQLRYTDEDPANTSNIIQLYTGWSVPKTNSGGGVTQWNREHTWSKSHGDFGDTAPAGTDLHHLRPCDATVNSAKGNKDFDEGGTLYVDASPYPGYSGNTGNYTTTYTWEPRDEDKGDVARMMMYMAVRYEGTDTSYDLELVDYTNTSPSGQPYYGKLSTLLEWHEQDPPDAWELRRNERIAERQGNRNPFVDHPQFAYMLWTPYPRGATAVTTTGFTLNWSQPIAGNTYYLQVARDPEFTNLVSGYSNYNAGTSTSKVISGLSAGTTYYYRLRTFFGSGYSMFSPVYSATTISPDPQATTATISLQSNNIVLQITPVPGANAYRVHASDNPYGQYSDVSVQGSFNGTIWTSPVGELPKRFYRVYGVWE